MGGVNKWGIENIQSHIQNALKKIEEALDTQDIQTAERYLGELKFLLKGIL